MVKNEDNLLYEVELLALSGFNPDNDNIDVYVYFSDGRRYVATFFTIENIRTLMEKDKNTGESRGGIYFWASDMVIVQRIEQGIIEEAVADLLETGEFEKVFSGPLGQS